MENKLSVFISSVMNKDVDDLLPERGIAKEAIESLAIGLPWRFEDSPASPRDATTEYLSAVKETDLFVLLLSTGITPPVQDEYYLALANHKPIFPFVVKPGAARTGALNRFLAELGRHHKYKECDTATLRAEICRAVALWIQRVSGATKEVRDELRRTYVKDTVARLLHRLAMGRSTFDVLDRDAPRTTLEMMKERPTGDALLPLMAKIPSLKNVRDQVKCLTENHFATQYADSWVDHEVQLIGAWVLKKIVPRIGPIRRMYDAGCGNCGQYKALLAVLGIAREEDVEYIGQDYNPDWGPFFCAKRGTFVTGTLPTTSGAPANLLACTHVLQDLVENPIAVYASFFAFNLQIVDGGWCYVTVPDKDSQPGLLDVLEVSARDAGFTIEEDGRCRVTRESEALADRALGVTTFDYLLLRKKRGVSRDEAHSLAGFSFYRWNEAAVAQEHGIVRQGDINEEHLWIERELGELLFERDERMRTLRHLFNLAHTGIGSRPDMGRDPREAIRAEIERVHEVISGTRQQATMQDVCRSYLDTLMNWFLVRYAPVTRRVILLRVLPILEECLKRPRDVRVHLDELSDEQVGRLVRHLFDIQRHFRLDLRTQGASLGPGSRIKRAEATDEEERGA